MKFTPYPAINALLEELRPGIQAVLGDRLVGLCLFGSLVLGDFDAEVSDIDLLAAVTRDIEEAELDAVLAFHDRFARDHPRWYDRIEVAYVSVAALQTFKEQTSRIAVISPGEPLHFKEAGRDWLMNWYLVRESDAALLGPPPHELIPPVSKTEFLEAVGHYARAKTQEMEPTAGRRAQSYAILTMCRALYAHRIGEHVSKSEAATWAQRVLPGWAGTIQDALIWRRSPDGDASSAEFSQTERFVTLVGEFCSRDPEYP